MSDIRCLVGLHRWIALKWGSPRFTLDCRECERCRRFQVYAWGDYVRARRSKFEPVKAVEAH